MNNHFLAFLGVIILFLAQSCVSLKDPHCYEINKSKVVAYRMTIEPQELFGDKKKFSFYDKNNNIFFSTYSTVQPNCIPCDSSFIGVIENPDSLKKEVGAGVNIQIGSGNEIKK